MQGPEPTKEHHWLKQLVGEWRYETTVQESLESEPEDVVGTEHVYAVGDLWVQLEANQEMKDGVAQKSLITLGYDIKQGKFVGTFVSSMMDYFWYYEGEIDESGQSLILTSEGPDMTDETKRATYRDIIAITGPKTREFRSQAPGENGEWQEFMVMKYTRED